MNCIFVQVHGNDGFTVSKTAGESGGNHDELLDEAELAAVAEEKESHSFEIDPAQVIIFHVSNQNLSSCAYIVSLLEHNSPLLC